VRLPACRFVVAERLGSPDTEELFDGGIVFVEPDDLASAVLHYLRRPDERARIAMRGLEQMMAQPQWQVLVAPLRAIARERQCSA
jgi:hypothetical protein